MTNVPPSEPLRQADKAAASSTPGDSLSSPVPRNGANGASTAPSEKSPTGAAWLKPMIPIALIALCAEMGTSVLNNSTLPLYFTEGLGIGKDILALIVIPFYIAEVLFKVPLGVLADKIGRKPVMLAGCLTTVVTPLILMSIQIHPGVAIAISTLIAFGFLRLLDGLGGAALWPPLFAYVGDKVSEDKRGAAMGLLNLMYILGIALSFLIGGKLDDDFGPLLTAHHRLRDTIAHISELGHRHVQTADQLRASMSQRTHYFPSMYFAIFLFGLASIACLVGMKSGRSRAGTAEPHSEAEGGVTWESFKKALHKIPQFMGLAFVTFFGIGCIANLVKIFAVEEFHMTEQHFGMLIFITGMVIATVAYPLGHMSDKWGKPLSVKLGFALCAIGLWGIPILHGLHQVHEIAFVLSAAVMGIGFVIAFPAWNALLTSLCDESHRATVFSTVSTCQGVGVLVGIMTGGGLYQHVAHIAPFITSATLVTAGSVLALVFIRDSKLKLDL